MPDPEHERKVRKVRIFARSGCGFLAGALLGGFYLMWTNLPYESLWVVLIAVVCAMLANRYGERFWELLGGVFWW
ncbi:MAG: hypothetical protein AAF436_17725 [Myxococcota bacterium]